MLLEGWKRENAKLAFEWGVLEMDEDEQDTGKDSKDDKVREGGTSRRTVWGGGEGGILTPKSSP